MVTGDRVEAAAKAIRRTTLGEQYPRLATTVRWEDYTVDAEAALAAADECDRVAGVVRVDTNNLATLERIVYALRYTNWYRGDSVEAAGAVLTAIREVAAAGAAQPEETQQ